MHLKIVTISAYMIYVLQHVASFNIRCLIPVHRRQTCACIQDPGNHLPFRNWVTLKYFPLACSSEIKALKVTDGLTVPTWGS